MLALLNDRNRAWDASAAKARVAKWASSDGSGDKDKVSWSKYGRAFFVGSGEDFGDYHLPFADVVGGELKAVFKGVTSAAGAAQGARGASGYGGAKGAIEKYYNAFSKLFKDDSIKAPWAGDDRAADGWEEFTRAFGEFGGVERRYAHIANLQTRDNGDPDSLFSTTGRAIVFDSYSLDLGGFKEEIDPEAVREAMDADDADYHLLWDHDTTLVLARTKNGTLKSEIVTDPDGGGGVDFWGRVAKTSYAADLRVLMDRGDVDECSFAFTVAPDGEEWRLEDDGGIVRRVTKIKRLWDLTICARGAYPNTHSASVRNFAAAQARDRAHLDVETNELETEDRAMKPGLVAWDAELGSEDIACDISCMLNESEDASSYARWWVIDVNVRDGGNEAIVCRSTVEGGCYYLLSPISYDEQNEPVFDAASALQPVDEMYVAVPMAVMEYGDDSEESVEAYTAKLRRSHDAALEEARALAHEAVDEEFRANGAVTEDGGQGGDDAADQDAARYEHDVLDDDDDDNVLGHRPTTNHDETPVGIVDGHNGAVGDEDDEDDDDDSIEQDEDGGSGGPIDSLEMDDGSELAKARALARARGRVALA
jgi:HK97 family phage prohead protease